MKDGEKAILIPGASRVRTHSSNKHNIRVAETLKAMTEEVTVVTLETWSGNAKVKDKRGMVFFCNPDDLSPVNEDLYIV